MLTEFCLEDSLAEGGGFEPSRPFISCMLPRFHAHFLLRREALAGKTSVHKVVDVKVGQTAGVVSKDWL